MLRVSAKDFGATGDGVTLETAALRRALAALAASGGGELVFPAGAYLSGALPLIDNLTIRLEEGAVLQASPHPADHFHDAAHGRWLCHYFLYGKGIRNFRLVGAGVLDGSGEAYWEKEYLCGLPLGGLPPDLPVIHYNVLKPKVERPVLLYLENCSGVTLEQVSLRNAACYTVWCVGCHEVSVRAVSIRNPVSSLRDSMFSLSPAPIIMCLSSPCR